MSIIPILEDDNPWWRDPGARPATAMRCPVRRRPHAAVLASLRDTRNRRAAVVLGPRQVGKTTLLLQLIEDLLGEGWPAGNIVYFDFGDHRLPQPPEPPKIVSFRPPSHDSRLPCFFFLDEIQRYPRWGDWLRQSVDRTRGDRFVVTGSAAAVLRETARESGPGRWDEYRMEGVTYDEYLQLRAGRADGAEDTLRRRPGLLEHYLSVGGFPEHVSTEDTGSVRRRLRTDVADRAISRDLPHFGLDVERAKDLFVYLVQDSGAAFNASSRARDLDSDHRAVRGWLRRLSDAFLVVPLPRRLSTAAARMRAHPKVYALDHGLVTAFAPLAAPLQDPVVRARVYETVVFRHLRHAAHTLSVEPVLSYFRKDETLEIDFIADLGGRTVGIEVTAGRSSHVKKLRVLERVRVAARLDEVLLVSDQAVQTDRPGVRGVSLGEFLRDPASKLVGKKAKV